MPAFELEQVDGGDPLDLPFGNTVLGRGPFLGVGDKRVSRNHATLENLDGRLRLRPVHTNPCFIQASLEAPPQPLEKDQWHCLREGSIFSLLPGKYIYRVHAVSEASTPRTKRGPGPEADMEETSRPPRLCEETLAYTPQARSGASHTPTARCVESERGTRPPSCGQMAGEALVSTATGASAPQRKKRVLPAWMMAASPAPLKPSPATAVKQAPARSTPNPTRPKRAARARLPLSGEEEEEEEEEESEAYRMPRKRARRLKIDPDESQQDEAHASHTSQERSPGGGASEGTAVANAEEREEEEVIGRGRTRAEVPPGSGAGGSPTATEDSTDSQANEQPLQNGRQRSKVAGSGDGTSSTPKSKAQQRTPCPYGASCYRKNPIHFRECSHPGDGDYEEERTGEDDDDGDDRRPECPYGTDCYRKNPLHKKEYKHTKPPVKMSVPGGTEDDDDEDHYEDSFINDESEEEEVDEGSDYVPESDDSGKEDVKLLQKEARAFLRKKKK